MAATTVPILAGKLAAVLAGLAVTGVLYAGAWIGVHCATVATLRGSTARMTPESGVRWPWTAAGRWRSAWRGVHRLRGRLARPAHRDRARRAVGYLVVFELGLRIVLGIARRGPARAVLAVQLRRRLADKAQWHDDYNVCNATRNQACEPPHWAIHLNQGLLVLGVAVLLTAGAAFWSMRRRDIT